MSPEKSPLRQLADIISSAANNIDAAFEKAGFKYPDMNAPFNPTSPAEGLSMSPEVLQNAMLAVAACAQLSATVHIPAMTLYDVTGGFHVASAFRAALEANVVEILRGHVEGLHVKDIAAKNGLDSRKLSRILRVLATHHVFLETSPDVFANNRLSSMLDTFKSIEEIQKSPTTKHIGTSGMAALIEHSGDEVFKSSAYLTDLLLDPIKGHSEAPGNTAFNLAFNTTKHVFDWYEEPGNELRSNRYGAAMAGSAKFDPQNAILMGLKWKDLPVNAVVVDVGGGLGHMTMKIMEENPNLSFIIQDRPKVLEQAKEFWSRSQPNAIANGKVVFQGHDFFTPQPVKNASVFLLRMITHDYGKDRAITILRQLRQAATKDTKLVIVDQVVPYSCIDETAGNNHDAIPGATQPLPPKPLLANLGKANAISVIGDMQMFASIGGEERTLGSFIELTNETGWKIIQIFPLPGSLHKQVLATPI